VRQVLLYSQEFAEKNPDKVLFMSVDRMDQLKTFCPNDFRFLLCQLNLFHTSQRKLCKLQIVSVVKSTTYDERSQSCLVPFTTVILCFKHRRTNKNFFCVEHPKIEQIWKDCKYQYKHTYVLRIHLVHFFGMFKIFQKILLSIFTLIFFYLKNDCHYALNYQKN
jgi:hypothetical protein